jgi:ABC-type nitrate/sulfonate/bicarbonate transport system ATPase subunit
MTATKQADHEDTHLLRSENLCMTFKDREGCAIRALDNLNIHVDNNEFVTLLGPSGCGKSTTFNIIAGLVWPNSGNVFLRGKDVTGETGHVGYMFQKDLLLPWRTVLRNMTLGAEAQDHNREESLQRALDLLPKLGLEGRGDSYPADLSGGMRQRVAFGRTLMLDKELLLLDEPLGALDAQTREYMQEWLLEVWRDFEKTIILVSHDLDEAIFLSDRIYVLTSRPGSVRSEIIVDLARPRTEETRLCPRFGELHVDIYRLIRAEERTEYEQEP